MKWSAPAQSMRCFEHTETTTAHHAMSRLMSYEQCRKDNHCRENNIAAENADGPQAEDRPARPAADSGRHSFGLLHQLIRDFIRAVDLAQSLSHRAHVHRDGAILRLVENEVADQRLYVAVKD